jgi:hypothetical protein
MIYFTTSYLLYIQSSVFKVLQKSSNHHNLFFHLLTGRQYGSGQGFINQFGPYTTKLSGDGDPRHFSVFG